MPGKPRSAHRSTAILWALCSCHRDEVAPHVLLDGLQGSSLDERSKLKKSSYDSPTSFMRRASAGHPCGRARTQTMRLSGCSCVHSAAQKKAQEGARQSDSSDLEELEKEQTKPKCSWRRGRARVEQRRTKTTGRSNEATSWLLGKINQMHKPLARLTKRERERETQINKITDERGAITTGTTEIQRIVVTVINSTPTSWLIEKKGINS